VHPVQLSHNDIHHHAETDFGKWEGLTFAEVSVLPESFNQPERYERYLEIVRARATSREFGGSHAVPREHYEMITGAAR